jgi:hypothetical protein
MMGFVTNMPQDKYSDRRPDERVEPTMWESGAVVGKDLDVKTPGTDYAAHQAIPYGDTKTASVNGRGSEAAAAIAGTFKAYHPSAGRADKHSSNTLGR